MPLTNRMANQRREKDCFAVTAERKYYHAGNSFVKRSLRPSEWQVSHVRGTIHVPRMGNERLLNEAETLNFIREKTDIPIPKLHGCFEDDDAVYIVMEYVEGVGMDSLDDEQKLVVKAELERHLKTLRSTGIGGPTGITVPPYRVTTKTSRDEWTVNPPPGDELVFCHNDLSQQNVIVDPESLRINAIIDWEYAGFWPAYFERRFFERPGPSVALEGEDDDSARLLDFLHASQRQTN